MSVTTGGTEPSGFGAGWPVTVAVLTWLSPSNGAGREAVHVTFAPGASGPAGQLMASAGTVESFTEMVSRSASPVLVTSKVTSMVEPALTRTPGADSEEAEPLIFFTTDTLDFCGTKPWASSVAVSVGGVEPSALTGGTPETVTVSECSAPAGRPGRVAVHVMTSPGARVVAGQVRSLTAVSESVTLMSFNSTSPVLVTTTRIGASTPSARRTPGAVSAASSASCFSTAKAGWPGAAGV